VSPIGLVLAGILSSHFGVEHYFVAAAAICCIPGVLILTSRTVNEIDRNRGSSGVTTLPEETASL
jgi:hypothetical protein